MGLHEGDARQHSLFRHSRHSQFWWPSNFQFGETPGEGRNRVKIAPTITDNRR